MAQPNRTKPPETASDWLEIDVPGKLPIILLVSSVLFPSGVLSPQAGLDRGRPETQR